MENNNYDIDIEKVYPVGSIFLQAVEYHKKTPQELFGGVWEEMETSYFWGFKIVTWKRIK